MNPHEFARRTMARLNGLPTAMNEQDRALMERLSARAIVTAGAAVILYDESATAAEITAIRGCVRRYQGDPKILLHLTNTYWDEL